MTEAPPVLAATPDLLQAALEQLRLEGAIFFRSELTEGFAFESTPLALADALHPGAERLILFHIVARGSCWVAADDGERHWANQGDVIVLPYGDQHTIGGATPAESVSILTLIDPLPWDVMPTIQHGGGGAPTDLVCGYLRLRRPAVRSGDAGVPARVRRAPPRRRGRGLGAGEHRVRAHRVGAHEREPERDLDAPARSWC